MSSKIEYDLNQYIRIRRNISIVLDDAGRAERFLSKPNNNRCPSMYKCLETYYDPRDWGYHLTLLRSSMRNAIVKTSWCEVGLITTK